MEEPDLMILTHYNRSIRRACVLLGTAAVLSLTALRADAAPRTGRVNVIQSNIQIAFNNYNAPTFIFNWGSGSVTTVIMNSVNQTITQVGTNTNSAGARGK
jgi:hypothetical protein